MSKLVDKLKEQFDPSIKIDWNRVEKLAIAHCRGTEIAAYIGMHPDTFYRRCQIEIGKTWLDWSRECQEKGKSLLREKQYDKALDGDVKLLLHLGKHLLDQKDDKKQDNDESGPRAIEDLAKSLGGGNQEVPRLAESERPDLANQQSLLHQEQQRSESTV